jgi:hypothetical protein
VIRATGACGLQKHAARAAHAAALESGATREPKAATWIREHGDANTMTVVSNDEKRGNGYRVWVIHCDACDNVIRIMGAGELHSHANCVAHVAAVMSGRAPESAVATWMREHGDANRMTVVSNDETDGRGHRVWVIHCGACGTVLRARAGNQLQTHAASTAHAGAIDSANAREPKVSTWMREHGDANQMTVVSNDEINGSRNRVWVISCAACDKSIRVTGVTALQRHADAAAHSAALSQRSAPRKRVRS